MDNRNHAVTDFCQTPSSTTSNGTGPAPRTTNGSAARPTPTARSGAIGARILDRDLVDLDLLAATDGRGPDYATHRRSR